MKIIKRINMLQALLVLIFGAGMISCDVSENGREAKIAVKNDTMAPAVPDSISRFAWKQPVYDSTKQYIYLTFDDGPGSGTNDCFILCRQTGVKATFFMVGMHVGSRDWQLVNNIKQGYPQFLLANHSYTHANERYIFL